MQPYPSQGEVGRRVRDPDEPMVPHNLVDMVVFGRRLRALRILQGFDRVTELTELLRRQYGVEVSDRTVYAIERGEQLPHIDFYFAMLCALESDPDYFLPAMRPDCAIIMSAKHTGRR